MNRKLSLLRNEAGVTIFTVVIVTTLVAMTTLTATPSYREKLKNQVKEIKSPSELINNLVYGTPKEQESPLSNPPKTEEQASPFKNFDFLPVDPSKQPRQPAQPPPEPVTAPSNEGGGPISPPPQPIKNDPCVANYRLSEDGKTKTPVPGSCNKAAQHGSRCSHFPSYH